MYFVYILYLKNKKFYIGFTSDIRRRIDEHKKGKNHTTKRFLPVKLIFCEIFLSKSDALRREKYFKTSKGRSTIKLMLRDYLNN